MKMLYQIKDEKPVMLSVAESYRDTKVREKNDADYGEGASDFFCKMQLSIFINKSNIYLLQISMVETFNDIEQKK